MNFCNNAIRYPRNHDTKQAYLYVTTENTLRQLDHFGGDGVFPVDKALYLIFGRLCKTDGLFLLRYV